MQLSLLQMLTFTGPEPRVQTTQQYMTSCRIQGTGSADGTTISQVWHSKFSVSIGVVQMERLSSSQSYVLKIPMSSFRWSFARHWLFSILCSEDTDV